MTCNATRIVQAPLERVWDLYSDLHLRPSLFLDIIDYTEPDVGRMAEGVTWTEKRRALRAEHDWKVTILEVQAQKKVRYSVRSDLAEFTACTTLRARGVDTVVDIEIVGEMKSHTSGKNAVLVITKPIVVHALQRALDRDLLNLANAAEYGLPERSRTSSITVTPAPREEPVELAPKQTMKAAQHEPQDAPTPTLPTQSKNVADSATHQDSTAIRDDADVQEVAKTAGNQNKPAAPPQQRTKKPAGQKAQQSKKKKRNAQRKARRRTRT